MTVPPDRLIAGYSHRDKGASYRGALRDNPRNAPLWTCDHEHFSTAVARRCAESERERRVQGAREVLELEHCKPCSKWWQGLPDAACPWCYVPLERVKVIVLERLPS